MKALAVVIGSSSGVGRRLAELSAKRGHNVLLVARDEVEMDILARDLRIQFQVKVQFVSADLGSPQFSSEEIIELVQKMKCDCLEVFLVAGAPLLKDDGALLPGQRTYLFQLNALSHIQIIEDMLQRGLKPHRVCFFSSIAAHAPRGKNVIYSAAKMGGETYFKALRHQRQDIEVQIWVLGYIDTALSFGQKLLFPKVSAEFVAQRVLGTSSGGGVYFLPWFWRWICFVLRSLPWTIYRRLKF